MLFLQVDKILAKQGKTKYSFGKETQIAQTHMLKICNGGTNSIRFETLEKICLALNCSINDLFYSDDPRMNKLLSGDGEK